MEGLYFKIDENSVYQHGQVIFRYLPVKLKKRIGDEDNRLIGQYPEHPIYAVLKPYALDFYFHGVDAKTTKEESGNEKYHHTHICILHLPLSLNLAAKDNLSSVLSEIYHAKFEINECYEIDYQEDFQGYWNLPQFSDSKKNSKQPTNSISIRKIILDFIFDLERSSHSSVFDAAPTYEAVEVRLKENFFFSSISAKAAYYYHRAIYKANRGSKNEKRILAEKLAKVEIQWLNQIRHENATQEFWHQDWFNNVEEELRPILFSKKFNRVSWRERLNKINGDLYKNQDVRILREATRFFQRRYDLFNGFRAILKLSPDRIFYLRAAFLVSFVLLPVLLYYHNKNGLESTTESLFAVTLYLFLGIIPFLAILSILLRELLLPFLGAILPRLIMAITSAWLLFSTTEELVKESFDIQFFDPGKIAGFLLIIPVFAFTAVEIRNMAPEIKPIELAKRIVNILVLGLIYSILIGLFFINATDKKILARSGYLSEFIKSNIDSTTQFILTNDLKAIGIGLLDDENDLIQDYNKDSLHKDIKKKLLNTKILSDTAIGRLSNSQLTRLAYFHENIDSINDQKEDRSWVSNLILASQERAFDSLSAATYNFSLYNRLKLQLKYDIPVIKNIPIVNNNWEFIIFPGKLFYRAIFALFIGIFIQLIFEDKPITEPL